MTKTVMHQNWRDLLFLHWTVDPALIQWSLPQGLTVDTFNNQAYIGLVPFFMQDVRLSWTPPFPGISAFMETNLRTYVKDEEGHPGVWFYTLACDSRLAVWWANTYFHLPYQYCPMEGKRDGEIDYQIGSSRFRYAQKGEKRTAQEGTLDHFLIERYRLFTKDKETLISRQVRHTPYPLYEVDLKAWSPAFFTACGFETPKIAPEHVVMSPGVDVEILAN